MREQKILFVDDDFLPSDYYLYALNLRQIPVSFCVDTESAVATLDKGEPALAILDVMMPPGVFEDRDTREGLTTGYELFCYLRRKYSKVPVVVLTNALSAPDLFRNEEQVRVISKCRCPPMDLALLVEGLLNQTQGKPFREMNSNGQ